MKTRMPKVAIVTGGASGMGRVASLRMAKAGAQVALVDVDEARLQATAGEHPNLRAYRCDVSNSLEVAETIRRIHAELGPVDRLVTAAAIMPGGRFDELPADAILRIMAVNYGGTVNAIQATLPGMLSRNEGEVVIFGSIAGVVPSEAFGAYGASKAATNFFAEVLFQEHRRSALRFLLVAPSIVNTPLVLQAVNVASIRKAAERGKMASPEEIIDAVEDALARGRSIVYPGEAALFAALRRLSPRLTWALARRLG
jgi:NAD(P)-dependent dehydrogenase (short-subunit alcohol dehydrogenase family)